jgi:hypothetical protein
MATFPFKENKSDIIILPFIPFYSNSQITMLRFLILPKLLRG